MTCNIEIKITDNSGVLIGNGTANLSDRDILRIVKDLNEIIFIKDINGNSNLNFTIP